jgi:hypothetical protein
MLSVLGNAKKLHKSEVLINLKVGIISWRIFHAKSKHKLIKFR